MSTQFEKWLEDAIGDGRLEDIHDDSVTMITKDGRRLRRYFDEDVDKAAAAGRASFRKALGQEQEKRMSRVTQEDIDAATEKIAKAVQRVYGSTPHDAMVSAQAFVAGDPQTVAKLARRILPELEKMDEQGRARDVIKAATLGAKAGVGSLPITLPNGTQTLRKSSTAHQDMLRALRAQGAYD